MGEAEDRPRLFAGETAEGAETPPWISPRNYKPVRPAGKGKPACALTLRESFFQFGIYRKAGRMAAAGTANSAGGSSFCAFHYSINLINEPSAVFCFQFAPSVAPLVFE